jgi:hypothetical protein
MERDRALKIFQTYNVHDAAKEDSACAACDWKITVNAIQQGQNLWPEYVGQIWWFLSLVGHFSVFVTLGSRLIDFQSQKMTVAARATADRKVVAHLS